VPYSLYSLPEPPYSLSKTSSSNHKHSSLLFLGKGATSVRLFALDKGIPRSYADRFPAKTGQNQQCAECEGPRERTNEVSLESAYENTDRNSSLIIYRRRDFEAESEKAIFGREGRGRVASATFVFVNEAVFWILEFLTDGVKMF
jgi:hypothetical protein